MTSGDQDCVTLKEENVFAATFDTFRDTDSAKSRIAGDVREPNLLKFGNSLYRSGELISQGFATTQRPEEQS
jgi:hypothetical protein